MSYQQFAYLYDHLMQDAPYNEWLQWIDQVLAEYEYRPNKIVDLACGTGAISIPLASKGYDVVGVDLSEDMLAVAQHKSQKAGLQRSIHWLQQDMAELLIPDPVEMVVCLCDSINYVVQEDRLQQVFARTFEHLTKGGLFLFDCHSIHMIKNTFGYHTFGSNEEEVSFLWQCRFDEHKSSVDHELTFFVQQQEGHYLRYDEVHTQRGYTQEHLTRMLVECGFQVKAITADFKQQQPTEYSERLFFEVIKP